MVDENKKNFYINRNIKLMPSYIALTWDVIFIWTISTMFFSTEKGLDYSQIIALDSILMLIGCVICIPINKFFEKIPSSTASRLGTLGYAAYILLCIFGTSYYVFVIAQVFLAFAYTVNSVKVNKILTESLSVVNRNKDYERVYGKGLFLYYVLEAVGAILITYVYSWNHYAGYWASLGVVVLAEVISIFITDAKKFQQSNIKLKAEVVSKNDEKKSSSYFKILKSGFFVCLLIYICVMRGTLSIVGSGFKVYLQQLTEDFKVLPIWLFGYIYAGIKITSAISSKYQFKFNLKFGVRSIVIFTFFSIVTFIINGVIYLINPSSIVSIILIVISTYIQGAMYAPIRIFANNYMQVCMHPKDMDKSYSIRVSVEYFGYATISALYAMLLSIYSDNVGLTNLVFIGILILPIVISMVLFIKFLIKKHAQKYTIINDEYVND